MNPAPETARAGSASGEPFLVAVTGASGAIYAAALLKRLRELGIESHVVLSAAGEAVAAHEGFPALAELAERRFANDDLFAPCASGTARYRAMAVVPCSMGTLGRIAHGVSDSLITRAADVFLKERLRPLVLVPRETPYGLIHVENMATLVRAGARIVPASPSFYRRPERIDDLVASVVGKVLEQCGIEHGLYRPWGEEGR
ncbi:MAG: UbiX family flavin prenyltransferase [Fibrobacterales bacterium]|nr:UbiX family flavin prenyltransferase [Fibrobacterales bacterium]